MKKYLSLVKFSHTIFAMPFALIGVFLAHFLNDLGFRWEKLGLVLLCMVFARNAAMAFNRYLDQDIDKLNPRTATREIPAGKISSKSALVFVILNCIAFVATTYFINPLCLTLSPVALSIVLGYSYTKRFTALCHMVLGLGLALAPVGAYLAVANEFHLIPVLYGFSVLFWVSGFDIIYALQDEGFDKEHKLHSTPVALGKSKALIASRLLHLLCASLLIYNGYLLTSLHSGISWMHWTAVSLFIGLLIYQHTLVSATKLDRINLAFFTTNGIASLLFGTLVILDFYF
jgi:4-hydroxybenzoate polyprenyltransferase